MRNVADFAANIDGFICLLRIRKKFNPLGCRERELKASETLDIFRFKLSNIEIDNYTKVLLSV
jgi:hypothetical protein